MPKSLWAYQAVLERYASTGRSALARLPIAGRDGELAEYSVLQDIEAAATDLYLYLYSEVVDAITERNLALNESADKQQRLLLNGALLLGLLMFAIGAVCVQRLFKPIQALTEYAGRIDFDNLEMPQRIQATRDETGLLIDVFAQMVERLRAEKEATEERRRMEQLLAAERSQRIELEGRIARIQLRAMQSQINSHFLFNSLNMVGKLAYLENAPRSQKASEHIAHFLRGALNQFDRKVTVAEEMDLAWQYVEIQQMRFGARIAFVREMDPACAAAEVLPMILQPLIENALVHGVGAYRGGGSVRCYACIGADGTGFCLGVEDNGAGFTEEERARVLSRCHAEPHSVEDAHGIGLANVFWRLKLEYGEQVDIRIESVPLQKTVVELGFKGGATPGILK